MNEPMPPMRPVDPDVVRGDDVPTPRQRAVSLGRFLLVAAVVLAAMALGHWVGAQVFAHGSAPLWYWALWFSPFLVGLVMLDVRWSRSVLR